LAAFLTFAASSAEIMSGRGGADGCGKVAGRLMNDNTGRGGDASGARGRLGAEGRIVCIGGDGTGGNDDAEVGISGSVAEMGGMALMPFMPEGLRRGEVWSIGGDPGIPALYPFDLDVLVELPVLLDRLCPGTKPPPLPFWWRETV